MIVIDRPVEAPQEDFDLTAPPPATYTAAEYQQEQIASANSTMLDEETEL